MNKMNPEIKTRWVRALRSGKYKQTFGELYGEGRYGEGEGHCCLGVLRHVVTGRNRYNEKPEDDNVIEKAYLSEKFEKRCGLTFEQQKKLAKYNDRGKTFKWIASYIERHL